MILHDIKLSHQVWFPQAQLARWEHNVLAQGSTVRHESNCHFKVFQ